MVWPSGTDLQIDSKASVRERKRILSDGMQICPSISSYLSPPSEVEQEH